MSDPIRTLWKLMREKFGPEKVDEDWFGEAYLYSQEEVSEEETSRPIRTYQLGMNNKGEPWILCKVCGMKSYHPKDIEEKFCGNCHRFLR